jgi:hypothetical protein
MDRTNIMLGLIVALAFTTFFFTGYWNPSQYYADPSVYGKDDAVQDALEYLLSCPTFTYDGVGESVRVKAVVRVQAEDVGSSVSSWNVVIEFDCRNLGYGDRTGKMPVHAMNCHSIMITVREGEVVRAIIDEAWDELEQKEV